MSDDDSRPGEPLRDGRSAAASAEVRALQAENARLRAEIAALRGLVPGDRERHQGRLDEALANANRHRAHFEAVFTSMRDGVVVFDMEGQALLVNEAAARITGFASAAEMRRDVGFFAERYEVHRLDGERLPVEEWPVSRVLRGESLAACRVRVRDRVRGQEWVFEYSGEPIRDEQGQQVFAVVITRDVTEQRRAEEALRDADHRKDEFLAMLSHELRNPLAPIRNGLFILENAEPGSDQARRALAVIDRQVSHLSRLVDDLLDVTRIARGKLRIEPEPIDLDDLVRRAAEDHRSIFEASGVSLSVVPCGRPLPLDADPTRLAQVIGNLLQNAAKFTPSGGRTTVEVEEDPARRLAVIRVRDSGIGMLEETLRQLFVPFVQAERALARSQRGLGLGLALVKGIVELHGGEVTAASAGPGKGSELVVRLPLAAAPALAAAPSPASRPRPRRRILVIEDNVDAAETLREVLELRDHLVEVAYDGAEGIERARASRPDVVLCDLGLPMMDGYAVAEVLRADASLSGVRLVALSGYALPEDVARAKQAGYDAHLAKPPRVIDLERILGQV